MTPTIRIRQVELDQMQEFWSRHRNLESGDQVTSKLAYLLTFITQLRSTESGQQDLANRKRRFGDCRRLGCEEDHQFYGRLRVWLDRELGS
jgi:hypothetical protein